MRPDNAQASAIEPGTTRLSVVVPTYNEQEALDEFHRRLTAVMKTLCSDWEVIYVNDGSRDGTLAVLRGLARLDEHVVVVDLSRNFGKEIAMTAGLDRAAGDAVVLIDADLQDPPELIAEFLAEWRSTGVDVVYGKRRSRAGETGAKRLSAYLFYRFIQRIGRVHIPKDTGDFRLMSRRAVLALRRLREQNRFMKGLFAWIGFPQTAVDYDRDARFAGKTKFNYWRLWNFAIEGVTSFTTAPLRLASYIGLAIAVAAFVFGAWIVADTLLHGSPVPGYPSLIVVVLFLGGVQLISIGVLGEYVGRMFEETKGRPLYLIQGQIGDGLKHAAEQGAVPPLGACTIRSTEGGRDGVIAPTADT